MLILTRRPGERVIIGDEVTVTVMEVTGQTVRLGIAAPKGLPVYREEIWLAVQAENVAAAQSEPDALAAKEDGSSPPGRADPDALATREDGSSPPGRADPDALAAKEHGSPPPGREPGPSR